MKNNENQNNPLEPLRDMVIDAVQKTNDSYLLDLVWKLLLNSAEEGN